MRLSSLNLTSVNFGPPFGMILTCLLEKLKNFQTFSLQGLLFFCHDKVGFEIKRYLSEDIQERPLYEGVYRTKFKNRYILAIFGYSHC